ncbi:MAG: HAD-IA family hydrolase [Alphaproteobacteria bacterium]|nr:HAD family hydrolase [Alphaproteobacteria bacterium]MDE2336881.1 HAD-IA family hydrolase [Alphaproteobacteria bacterium]
MTLPKPRAVIFDWDDTIIDSWGPTLRALNAALAAMGEEPWTDEEARRRCGASARDLFRQLFGDRWQEADRIFFDALRALFSAHIPVFAGAEPVLKALDDNKIYMAVVSNKRGPLLREEAKKSGLERYFGKIVGAGDAAADKPDPAPVHMALEGSGIAAGADVWFVGDSHTDMLCAANAGCLGFLIETKPPPAEALLRHPPRRRFREHSDFMEYIESVFA